MAGTMQKIAVMTTAQRVLVHHNSSSSSNPSGDASNALTEYNGSSSSSSDSKSGRFDADLHGNVNILLGGGVIMMVVLICYCCHKNVRKHRPQEYSQYWRAEPDVHSLEVFTMDAHAMQCLERPAGTQAHQEEGAPLSLPVRMGPVTSGPPPAYESLIFGPRSLPSPIDKKDESDNPDGIITSPVNSPPSESETNRINKQEEIPRDDQDLPSYEAALKLEADGYV
ncbi:uncharacterized protein LOC105286251 isoform X2 [Ooceraea biroi]|uniref:uncharacterized protein LOC105286251 isoform X2 n=1 Tax=Ooceraea biroi TaxID=2015173 RepID=UPI0005B79D64|nr:uncharacterized protein LOC105286251 isoform X2 [Ooceraea biroi]